MTTEEKIKVMQAYVDGKTIECKSIVGHDWGEIEQPVWFWGFNDYRIKPDAKLKKCDFKKRKRLRCKNIEIKR